MKFTIGILLGIILGAFIIIGILAFLLFSNLFSGNPISSNTPNTTPNRTTIASATPTINASPSPSSSTIASSTPNAGINTPTEAQDVSFDLSLISYNISGVTSGTVEASITNTGSTDAHNAQIRVEISSKGSPIKIDNQDYFQKDLGTIKAGATLTSDATLNVSAMDGLKIFSYGATIKLTIISDEKVQDMTYEISPQI